jgi:hypothetical protein
VLELSPSLRLLNFPGGVRLDVQAPWRLPRAIDEENKREQNDKDDEH